MCGRTSLFVPPSVLAERFELDSVPDYEPRYNVAPGDDLAVLREDGDAVEFLTWGLVPEESSTSRGGHVNARAETLDERSAFREAYDCRRCLVLADGFYEWQERSTGTQPFRVQRTDGEPFALAGLWEPSDAGGTVAVVTTGANDLLSPIHDRMPAVLTAGDERSWLGAASDDPLAPRPWDEFETFPVSRAVNDPANDRPAVVEPADVPERDPQTGLGEFE